MTTKQLLLALGLAAALAGCSKHDETKDAANYTTANSGSGNNGMVNGGMTGTTAGTGMNTGTRNGNHHHDFRVEHHEHGYRSAADDGSSNGRRFGSWHGRRCRA